ncbi:MAG: rRNA maturation RNase YbeY, partial [Desulfobulbaceae bacterium]
MPVDLSFHYHCPDCRINSRLLQRRAATLLRECRVADHGLSILLVDDQEISWLNDHYRHKSGPTNVLSFPFADGADSSLSLLPVKELGDIVISVDT